MNLSPLRYPGGKAKLTAYILETLNLNDLKGGTYVEPFAGGAAIAWYLLHKNYVKNIIINDLNPSIFSFWYCVINETDKFCKAIEDIEVTIEEWYRQKSIQLMENPTTFELGFSTFFLNRTNRSGIINAGVIGGYDQTGNYKLDCRFNKAELIARIKRIGKLRDQIVLTNLDAKEFLRDYAEIFDEKTFINIDPPYYVKGKGLYQNYLTPQDHHDLYETIRCLNTHWIVTYDDTPEIVDIYSEFSPKQFGLSYTAQEKRKGSELMIHSPRNIQSDLPPDISFKKIRKMKGNSLST